MKLLESKNKIELPKVFLVSDREDLPSIPIGVPFIFGDPEVEDYLIRLLEYEVLYQNAVKSGYPFDFRRILLEAGFKDITSFDYGSSVYMEFVSSGDYDRDVDVSTFCPFDKSISEKFKDFVRDCSCYVDIEKLKSLNVFPIWLSRIEDAIKTNIHNFATYNHHMYNKKLEGMYGGIELSSPNRNLIIIDISGSIPRAVSSTCLTLAKNLAESFYADLLITGSKSTLYTYENMHELDVKRVYDENGMDNDQVFFKKLVTEEKRCYRTAIVFGDNDDPGYTWCNEYNNYHKGVRSISVDDGKKLCQWEVDTLISLHTAGIGHLAAYGRWFSPKREERIEDWVKYLR